MGQDICKDEPAWQPSMANVRTKIFTSSYNPTENNPTRSANTKTSTPSAATPDNSENIQNFLCVTVNTVNGGKKDVFIPASFTGGQLKKLIYEKFCQSLNINEMSVIYEGTVIGNNKKLSDLSIVTGKNLVIRQDKIAVAEVANIIADAEGIDPISEEKGVAKMCCGHGIGRDTMTALIRSLISANNYQIRCPYPDENNLICNEIWEFNECRKVGVFTKEEYVQFEKGLSQNWKKQFAKQCPKCKHAICKDGLKTNRVICPSCNYGSFCYLCLNKWKGGKTCGNEDCIFLNEFLKNCPWDRVFKLRVNEQVFEYKTPKYRACVHCNMAIEHEQACKHMKCRLCLKRFCWVCLQTPVKGVWPCGGPYEYCGKVAQRQNI